MARALAATGVIHVIGSQSTATTYAGCSHNLHLRSQAENHTDKRTAPNSSGEVGSRIGQTPGIYLSRECGQAQGHGQPEQRHAEELASPLPTRSLLLVANDTTICGAQPRATTCSLISVEPQYRQRAGHQRLSST